MKTFTFFWRTGEREILKGDTAANALMISGYGHGALRALDFYAEGSNNKYVWDKKGRTWNAL